MAKLSTEARTALARKGGLARAANEEARGQAILGTLDREVLDSAIKQMKAAGREVTTAALLREIERGTDEIVRRVARLRLRTVPNRSPKRRGEYLRK